MTTAAAMYDIALQSGQLSDHRGRELPVGTWLADADDGDLPLLSACSGPTLDVGCGPGRLTAALAQRGIPALGIDISARAVYLARSRGAMALQRNVFGALAGRRRWNHILLADGNIGIGADPVRLLTRCAALLGTRGTVLLDLEAHGVGVRTETLRLCSAGEISDPFPWGRVGADAIAAVAHSAGLNVQSLWRSGSRWQAELGVGTLVNGALR